MSRSPHPRTFASRALALLATAFVALGTLAACTSSAHRAAGPTETVSPTRTASPADHPNIVFVLTDDLSMNLIASMPHVQAMQRNGTTLSNYYVVDSLCCPSRAAIFTGEYPHDNGVITNIGAHGGYPAFQKHGDDQRSFALSLARAGYRTGFYGKYLNGYSPKFPQAPGWNSWAATAYGYREFNYHLNVDGTVRHFATRPQDYLTDVISRMGGAFIRSSAAAHKPFMLELATFAPHLPYTPAPRYAKADPGVTYPRDSAFDTLPTDPPAWLAGRPKLTAANIELIESAYRQRIRADLAVDDMVGHLEDELKAAGVADNTYLVFSSDNGYHMGENRLLPGKQTAFDTDIHVPLIVTGPNVPAAHTSTQLASNVDLAPTFERLAGADVGEHVDGVDLGELWHGRHPARWQQAVLVEHRGPNDKAGDPDAATEAMGDPPSYEAVRTGSALYVRYAGGAQEYYDTVRDPNERHNIAASGVPAVLPRMLAGLTHCHDAAQCQAAAGG